MDFEDEEDFQEDDEMDPEELDEEDEEDDEGDDEGEVATLDAQGKKQSKQEKKNKKAEVAKLKKQLNDVYGFYKAIGATQISTKDKAKIKKANKHKQLKPLIAKIYALIAINKAKKLMKHIANLLKMIGPYIPYILIGLVIILAIIVVIAVIAQAIGAANDKENSTMFGASGKDFYGCRTVYYSEEQSQIDLTKDYVEMIAEGISSTLNLGSSDLTIDISIPDDNYDYKNLETDYQELGEVVWNIAKIVSKSDTKTASSATTLEECLDEIKYFGIPSVDENSNSKNDIAELIGNFIFSKTTDSKGSLSEDKVVELVSNNLTKYRQRTEKLYIKDFIFETEEEMVSGLTQQDYVAFMFMPKKNVTFTKISFIVKGAQFEEFSLKLFNEQNEIIITKEPENLGDENGDIYIYSTIMSASANIFTDIDSDNLDLLSEGMSLFDIVKDETINHLTYLQVVESPEDGVERLTFKQNGVYALANNPSKTPYALLEFETTWL